MRRLAWCQVPPASSGRLAMVTLVASLARKAAASRWWVWRRATPCHMTPTHSSGFLVRRMVLTRVEARLAPLN